MSDKRCASSASRSRKTATMRPRERQSTPSPSLGSIFGPRPPPSPPRTPETWGNKAVHIGRLLEEKSAVLDTQLLGCKALENSLGSQRLVEKVVDGQIAQFKVQLDDMAAAWERELIEVTATLHTALMLVREEVGAYTTALVRLENRVDGLVDSGGVITAGDGASVANAAYVQEAPTPAASPQYPIYSSSTSSRGEPAGSLEDDCVHSGVQHSPATREGLLLVASPALLPAGSISQLSQLLPAAAPPGAAADAMARLEELFGSFGDVVAAAEPAAGLRQSSGLQQIQNEAAGDHLQAVRRILGVHVGAHLRTAVGSHGEGATGSQAHGGCEVSTSVGKAAIGRRQISGDGSSCKRDRRQERGLGNSWADSDRCSDVEACIL